MSLGWVKLYREICLNPIWVDTTAEQKTLLMTILLHASHKPTTRIFCGKKVSLLSGQMITSVEDLKAKSCSNISTKKIRIALDVFKELEFVTIKTANKGSVITVVNWGLFQDGGEQKGKQEDKQRASQRANEGQTKGKPIYNKNEKNEKKTEENTYVPPKVKRESIPYQEIIDMYHQLLPALPKVRKLTDAVKTKIKGCNKNMGSLADWKEYFELVTRCPFLLGEKTDFRANLIWLVGPQNYSKVINGTYEENNVSHHDDGVLQRCLEYDAKVERERKEREAKMRSE